MRIIPLSEGSFTIDHTKEFVPFNLDTDDLQKRSTGSLLVEIQPFAVVTKKDVIIIDCGLGYLNNDDVLQIHQNLIANDIDPLSVTKVLLSHLHKDHAGGISKYDALLKRSFLSFPNAIYYVGDREIKFALQANSASYHPDKINILQNSDNVVLLDESGCIDDYINYETTSAHSVNHMIFWIREDNQTLFYGGDDAPQLQQMKSRFIAKYDYDGKKCMELRKKWWEDGQKDKWTFLFYHDIKHPVFSFDQQ